MFSRHLYHCHPIRTIISHQSYYNTLLTSFPFYILALLQYSPPTSSHQGMNLLKTLECLLFLNIRSFPRLQVPTRSGPASFSNHLPPWTRVPWFHILKSSHLPPPGRPWHVLFTLADLTPTCLSKFSSNIRTSRSGRAPWPGPPDHLSSSPLACDQIGSQRASFFYMVPFIFPSQTLSHVVIICWHVVIIWLMSVFPSGL